MNTSVNQTFNWSRFTATLRKEVVENKRALLFTVIGVYGFLTLIMILGNLFTGLGDDIYDTMNNHMPQTFVGGMLGFVVCISASLAFHNLTTKTGRANLFTLPSSMLEKFLVNVLIYAVGIIVVFFACAQLADLTRIAVLISFRSDAFYVPGPINFLNSLSYMGERFGNLEELSDLATGFKAAIWIGIISNAGLYLLGSVIWPRLSLLKTFAAMYAIEFALFIIAAPLFYFFGDGEALIEWFLRFIMGGRFSISMICITAFQVVLYFSLAWYLFKRKDVISLKWWK
ncbi:MAG: hypothetical protein IJV05_11835 [Muribaculaceae bacterium]|nr:hypothetical protein [Muribaculaceae bacterium]